MTAAAAGLLAVFAGAAWPAVSSTTESSVAVSTRPASSIGDLSTDDQRRALGLADLLIDAKRLDEAEGFARARAADQSDRIPWLMRLARISADQGRHAEAAAIFRELLKLQGESAGLFIQLGLHAQAAGETGMAQDAFERARRLDRGPLPPYYLSEIAFAQGRQRAGRSLAREALAAIPDGASVRMRRMQLRLKSRLGWDDAIDREFQELFARAPGEAETLFEWADALFRAGLAREAEEPLALLRERFPDQALRTRRYELARLRGLGAVALQNDLLDDSVRRWPDEPAFRFARGEQLLRRRRWRQAERDLDCARSASAYRRQACELLVRLHRDYDYHLGPYFTLHDSQSSRFYETGVAYRGYPRETLRTEAKAGVGSFSYPSKSFSQSLASIHGTAAWESGPWTAGADAEATAGAGLSGLSPGVFGRWEPIEGWALGGDAAVRRVWSDAADAVAAGATTDHLGARLEASPWPRVYLGGQGRYNIHHVEGGGRAQQTLLAPELVYRLLDRPFYLGGGYRFAAQDAWGQDAFFSKLSLIRRTRTHYATLSAGKSWLCGRLRTDGYVFNGQDDGRGRNFGSFDLAGLGAGFDWFGRYVRLKGGYSFSKDTEGGIGGTSHTVRLSAQWHWYGPGDKNGDKNPAY